MLLWTFNPRGYGPAVAKLLLPARLADLGPGSPSVALQGALKNLSDEQLFSGKPAVDPQAAACCRAGLWLYHDFLAESHEISQEVDSPTGSYWHGIMHRREPDPSNAKYWFRRVGLHPVFGGLTHAAAELVERHPRPGPAAWLARDDSWDPIRWIDLCEKVRSGIPELTEVCRRIAQIEWEMLFDHCLHRAVGDI